MLTIRVVGFRVVWFGGLGILVCEETALWFRDSGVVGRCTCQPETNEEEFYVLPQRLHAQIPTATSNPKCQKNDAKQPEVLEVLRACGPTAHPLKPESPKPHRLRTLPSSPKPQTLHPDPHTLGPKPSYPSMESIRRLGFRV